MTTELPEFYFRIRENGAVVFRVSTNNAQQRIEMDQIAVINIRNGEVKPHGQHNLTEVETAEIARWMDQRSTLLAKRGIDDIHRTVDTLNQTTQWAQSKASDEQLDEVTDRLLMAMYDLRTVLIRKKADRLNNG